MVSIFLSSYFGSLFLFDYSFLGSCELWLFEICMLVMDVRKKTIQSMTQHCWKNNKNYFSLKFLVKIITYILYMCRNSKF